MHRLSQLGVLLAGCSAAGLAAQQQNVPAMVEVGATPSYTFRRPLLGGRGVRSLADLHGRPTLIEFWGTR